MADATNSGYEYKRIIGTAAGTTVVKSVPSVLKNVFFSQSKTGTADFFDTNLATGTALSNQLFLPIPNVIGTPNMYEFNYTLKNGLTVVVGGTVDFTISTL